jgi:hypothetical protein
VTGHRTVGGELVDSPPDEEVDVTTSEVPPEACAVDGCGRPAAVSVPAPTAHDLVNAPAGDTVPLCEVHAEQADGREASPPS